MLSMKDILQLASTFQLSGDFTGFLEGVEHIFKKDCKPMVVSNGVKKMEMSS